MELGEVGTGDTLGRAGGKPNCFLLLAGIKLYLGIRIWGTLLPLPLHTLLSPKHTCCKKKAGEHRGLQLSHPPAVS